MYCEVCGKKIDKPYVVRIEGTEMKTCRECAKFGVEHKTWSRFPKKRALPKAEARKRKSKPKIAQEVSFEVVENYSEIIRGIREKLGLSREDFGKKINEKASVIARLETGKMVPDIKLAKKMEKIFGIKLLEKVEEEKISISSLGSAELTIGDIIKIKKKK